MKRIAVIGAGVSGLTAAWELGRRHHVTVFEQHECAGGHSHTVRVEYAQGYQDVDVGFIVFNDRTYPYFCRLLDELGVERQPSSMGFSVSARTSGIEYCGDGLGGYFARRRNLVSRGHWRMLAEILRFNREAPALLESARGEMPLGEYLDRQGYSERFRTHYILAMGGAIWSCGQQRMEDFPARFFVRFLVNHGLLQLRDRPQWYVVPGGSRTYVERMIERMSAQLHLSTPVRAIRRNRRGVMVHTDDASQGFDEVVLACHSDQALSLLEDADEAEQQMLAGIGWEPNEAVLHTDVSLLPRVRRAWSSWNALLDETPDRARVTYNMNILQGIDGPVTYCVTLNNSTAIDPRKVIGRYHFAHPVFTPAGLAAREQLEQRNGRRHTWFCGAWCRNGFHEDGVVSALRVVQGMEEGR